MTEEEGAQKSDVDEVAAVGLVIKLVEVKLSNVVPSLDMLSNRQQHIGRQAPDLGNAPLSHMIHKQFYLVWRP